MSAKTQTTPQSLDDLINEGRKTAPSIEEIILEWAAATKLDFSSEGSNDNSSELAQTFLKFIDDNGSRYFNVSQFVLSVNFLNLPYETTTKFFNNLIKYLIKTNYVKPISALESAYSWKSYQFIK